MQYSFYNSSSDDVILSISVITEKEMGQCFITNSNDYPEIKNAFEELVSAIGFHILTDVINTPIPLEFHITSSDPITEDKTELDYASLTAGQKSILDNFVELVTDLIEK